MNDNGWDSYTVMKLIGVFVVAYVFIQAFDYIFESFILGEDAGEGLFGIFIVGSAILIGIAWFALYLSRRD